MVRDGRREKEPFNVLRIERYDPEVPAEQLIQASDEELLELSDPVPEIRNQWNKPVGNISRLAFAFLSFIVAGMSDAVIGVSIAALCKTKLWKPYELMLITTQIEAYYGLNYSSVSLVFLTPFFGYSIAAFLCSRIHMRWGQRGVAILAPICHIVPFVMLAVHPPFPVLIVGNAFSGFGNGLADACFPAWVGGMHKGSTVQGFLTACYSIGALIAPLVAVEMISRGGLPWYTFYYIMVGLSVLELGGLVICFWRCDGPSYRAIHSQNSTESTNSGVRVAMKSKVAWIIALFLFVDTGVMSNLAGIGGWTVTYMLRIRGASLHASGMSVSGFWLGMALGRAILGFVNERFGVRMCTIIYLCICIGLELVLWLIPIFEVSAVFVALLGFFLGPMYPGGVMMAAKLLPKRMHVSAIGFAIAIGGIGGTVFPYIIGALAASTNVAVLQPIILILLVLEIVVWLCLPGFTRQIKSRILNTELKEHQFEIIDGSR
ncbi:major facilitator superfamily domain-containing protein [Dactylonectria estremocensis]|uniref:Major facilitator superfamily domain-containing protein n=1 Tax=Dactylonectria estremocensis TaxID=1079267 RepID=A0A9P9DQZ6_9HYPO|nr:major facilitator superfamily domain-containing protein [Dactylonectria estremocensis]